MTLRPLNVLDAAAVRQLRLRALRESPTAFGSSYAEESKLPHEAFSARLAPSKDKWIFGAFTDERLVGMVTLIREGKEKERHKASIYGMYVDPKQRRKGVGRQLLVRALDAAKKTRGLRQVRLAATEGNRAALQLYAALGFTVYGREADALMINGKFYAELMMVCSLE